MPSSAERTSGQATETASEQEAAEQEAAEQTEKEQTEKEQTDTAQTETEQTDTAQTEAERTEGDAVPSPPALDWAAFAERPLPEGGADERVVAPQAELAAVLQRRHEDLSAVRGDAARAASGARDTVYDLAVLVGRFDQLVAACAADLEDSGRSRLHRRLRILKEQMLQTLRDADVEVRDPLGLPAADVADWADPIGWRHGPQFTEETVAQTDEPAVFHAGAVVRLARVFMGSPEHEPAPAQAPAPAGSPAPGPAGDPHDLGETDKDA
ncbi:hypothetical protein GTW43_12715 [Streptomyces sp. SID5785]|uniref:hypothetical protein n=1 Tax=Streptomyces sp. SID5785 TaxID=2690309 RepID=UPI001360EA32|nr:hypothetical protein [Streptomyces sp. SID5785]MZD05942.1 hypothetical protein [Streptomyces sp. SID5785]